MVHGTTEHSQLLVGVAQHRVELARVHPARLGPLAGRHSEKGRKLGEHHPFGLPRPHPLKLLRETARIARGTERLLAEDSGGLVVPMPIARRSAEPQHDHIRAIPPDYPHHVGEDPFPPPFLERLGGRTRETEIDGAGEELLGAIDPPRRQQFLRADHPQLRPLLGADQVLPALAASQGKVCRAHVPAARKIRQHVGAFVVRVRAHDQHAAQFVQLAQRMLQVRGSRKGLRLRSQRNRE